MDHSSKIVLIFALVCSLVPSGVICRDLNPNPSLFKRLKLHEEATSTCWDSLFELQSCTGEIVLFFLNGETYLGPNCCDAIRTIQDHCWPSMLGSVGIDDAESDVLLGYCDAKSDHSNSGSPPTSPPLPPSPPQLPFSHVINP